MMKRRVEVLEKGRRGREREASEDGCDEEGK
jgi:hypothetical protein